LRLACLSETDAATLAELKTQFGTYLYLTDGGKDITPRWSLTELAMYQLQFFNRAPLWCNAGEADNKMGYYRVVIPLGRPQPNGSMSFLPAVVDPLVGWNTKSTPFLHWEVPADGNSVDNRTAKIAVVYKNSPFRYTKKWTSWATQTLSTTGYVDWIIGDKGQLLEIFAFQTTEENAALASDVPTIAEMTLERRGKSVLLDGDVFNLLTAMIDEGSAGAEDITMLDDYMYLALSQAPLGDFSLCVNLNLGQTKLRVKGGVADAAKFAFSIINGER